MKPKNRSLKREKKEQEKHDEIIRAYDEQAKNGPQIKVKAPAPLGKKRKSKHIIKERKATEKFIKKRDQRGGTKDKKGKPAKK